MIHGAISRPQSEEVKVQRTQRVENVTPMEEPTPGVGKPITIYRVNQRDSYVIVAQLSPEFTARLVDRWQKFGAINFQGA